MHVTYWGQLYNKTQNNSQCRTSKMSINWGLELDLLNYFFNRCLKMQANTLENVTVYLIPICFAAGEICNSENLTKHYLNF